MKVLRERTIHCEVLERYERHRFLARLLSSRAELPYTWLALNTEIRVRCVTDATDWQPVEVPARGTTIRFKLDAHVRINDRSGERNRRRSTSDYIRNLDWIEAKSAAMGLRIDMDRIDFDPITVPINQPERPFVKTGSRFRGFATVTDPDALLKSMSTGVGDAKAYGFGFFDFTVI